MCEDGQSGYYTQAFICHAQQRLSTGAVSFRVVEPLNKYLLVPPSSSAWSINPTDTTMQVVRFILPLTNWVIQTKGSAKVQIQVLANVKLVFVFIPRIWRYSNGPANKSLCAGSRQT